MQAHTWLGFLRSHQRASESARFLVAIGGKTATQTRERIVAQAAREDDPEWLERALDRLKEFSGNWRGACNHVDHRDGHDWHPVSEGATMRVTHITE
jgi:hypothetical protein